MTTKYIITFTNMNNEKAILLRLSKEDKQTIKDLAKSKRMSMTGYIRNEILNK